MYFKFKTHINASDLTVDILYVIEKVTFLQTFTEKDNKLIQEYNY